MHPLLVRAIASLLNQKLVVNWAIWKNTVKFELKYNTLWNENQSKVCKIAAILSRPLCNIYKTSSVMAKPHLPCDKWCWQKPQRPSVLLPTYSLRDSFNITTWRCHKAFSQWECDFYLKAAFSLAKGSLQHSIASVRQGSVRYMAPLKHINMSASAGAIP